MQKGTDCLITSEKREMTVLPSASWHLDPGEKVSELRTLVAAESKPSLRNGALSASGKEGAFSSSDKEDGASAHLHFHLFF